MVETLNQIHLNAPYALLSHTHERVATCVSSQELAAHELEKKSVEPLWAVFLNRATAEFTVLGILVSWRQHAATEQPNHVPIC